MAHKGSTCSLNRHMHYNSFNCVLETGLLSEGTSGIITPQRKSIDIEIN